MHSDLWGKALWDYHLENQNHPLILHTSFGEPETVPIEIFFRDQDTFSDLEIFACELCQGEILDVGAGTGSHSLWLQQADHRVTALEKSVGACQVMEARGVSRIVEKDLFLYSQSGFHTALMLMNGLGLAGTIDNLPKLLKQVFSWLEPDGQIIADSSDIAYLYDHNPPVESGYYGELEYSYEYLEKQDPWFPWLFIDFERLKYHVQSLGYQIQLLFEEEDQYLVRINRS